jgi:hypothetical protein
MESSLSESVQQLVRPGVCTDLYYPDPQTAHKACYRTTVNTRYVQQFANLSGGSSVFTIPPVNGVGDICLIMEIPAGVNGSPVFDGRGLALPRGWGYSAIRQVSFRYGGSSTYFLSQQQLLQNALRKTPNSGARDDLLALGGSACAGGAAAQGDFAVAQRAYVWLSLPHSIPSSDGKLPPIPSDLLTTQIQVTVELNPIASIFSAAAGAAGTPASSLSFAEFQTSQIMLDNQGDALARRVDMTSHALSYPLADFTQQEVIIPLANAVSQSVTLTGFRSGEVRNIQVWITDDADTSGAVKNPFKWYAPEDMLMQYAGEIFARFDKGSGALWNLVNGRQSPAVNEVEVTDVGGGACAVTTPFLGQWLELPFAQPFNDITAHSTYTAGKPITNGIVNLSFNLPQSLAPAATLKLHVSYNYNAVLTFSQGTCDYVI